MATTKLFYKNPTTGIVTANEVNPVDVQYWKSQGWTDAAPAGPVQQPNQPPAQQPSTQPLGEYVSSPDYLKLYQESEITRQPGGKVYLRQGVPVRWGQGTPEGTPPAQQPSVQPSPIQPAPIFQNDPNQVSGKEFDAHLGSLITARTGKPATSQEIEALQAADRMGFRSSTGINQAAIDDALNRAFPVPVTSAAEQERKLGPTEFKNLTKEWKAAGLTDTEIEQNFLRREGKDIFLQTNAPSTQELLAKRGKLGEEKAGGVETGTATKEKSTATNVMDFLGIPDIPSTEEMIADVLASPRLRIYRERLEQKGLAQEAVAAAMKDELETRYEADKSVLEQKLAERGLAFSGIRATQVKALADSLAASKLDVDRKIASQLLDMDDQLVDKVMDLVADRIKEAQEGRKEALGFLEDMGLTVNPLTGKLTPTLEAQRLDLAEKQFEAEQREPMKQPSAIQEYQYAQQQGYQGTFLEYQQSLAQAKQNQTLNTLRQLQIDEKSLTVPGQIVDANTGVAVELTDTQSQFFSMGQRLDTVAQEVTTLVDRIGTNGLKGWVTENGYLVPVVQNALGVDEQALMQKMFELNNTFVYFSTGKQINETEFQRLGKQTPNFRATVDYNRSALANFTTMIQERMANYLTVNGWKIKGQETNGFIDPNDPFASIDWENLDFSDF